ETVNGFYEDGQPVSAAAELAVVMRGSGCDFARTFRIPKRTDAALEVAITGAIRTVDLGRVTYTAHSGGRESRLFCNISSAGLTGEVAERVNRSGKPLGATVAFAWGAVAGFFGHENSRFRVRIDERELDQISNNVIVGNCRYFAGGMKILPMAEPDDGMLDVLVWGDVGKLDLAMTLHKLYRGTHVNHPKSDFSRAVRAARGRAAGFSSGMRLARSFTAASIRSSEACNRATSSRVARCSCESAAVWARCPAARARSLVAETLGVWTPCWTRFTVASRASKTRSMMVLWSSIEGALPTSSRFPYKRYQPGRLDCHPPEAASHVGIVRV